MAKSNPRTVNGHRRREVRARVLAEESVCGLCGGLVDKTLTTTADGKPHPWRAEVDEILPVSRGGSPTLRENCQLAHRACNAAKGNRVEVARVASVVPKFPISGGW
jgi:5-methylcytosine-specific restriction endonuclease McrA